MIEFRSMFSADRLASLHRRAFLPWYALFITSAGLTMYGTLATSAGVRDRSGVITAAGVCSVVTGIALLNTITRRFPLPIRVMFVAMWLAMAMAIIVLE